MRWSVERLAAITGGRVLRATSRPIEGAFFDSRTPRPGGLFVPIIGARDGHDYIPTAIRAGAAAVLQTPGRPLPAGDECGVVEVADTLAAFTALASDAREQCTGPVIAITGSNGKTTTRGMVAAALACTGGFSRVLCTRGNFNNNIGVPMTLVNGPEEPDAMVIEIGMNAPGEVDTLASVVRPTAAVITSVAVEHLEFMGSIEAIAAAEAEVVAHVAPGGAVFIPGDEPLLHPHVAGGDVRVVHFARSSEDWTKPAKVEVTSTQLGRTTRGALRVDGLDADVELELQLFGAHNLRNAAAALAVGLEHGLPLTPMLRALADFEPVGDRGRVHELARGHLIIADCYNANPGSMEVALASAAAVEPAGARIAVLGDMLELGPDEERFHRELGERAARLGLTVLGVGPRSRATVAGARSAGGAAEHLGDQLDAEGCRAAALRVCGLLEPRASQGRGVVLVKGSRGIALERVVAALLS